MAACSITGAAVHRQCNGECSFDSGATGQRQHRGGLSGEQHGGLYGTLSFGTYSALSTAPVTVALAGGVTLQCTPGVSVSMQVNGGLNNVSGRHLKMGSGTAQIAYQLFQDAARTQSLGIAQSVNVPYTNANAISLPIYGYVVLPGNQPAGTYSDTLQVQISY